MLLCMLFDIMYWVTDIFYCTFVLLSQQWLNKDAQSIMTIPPQWTRVVCGPCLCSTSGTTNQRLSGPREHARSHTSFCQLTAKKPSVCLFANNCQSVWLSRRINTVLRLRNLRLFKNAQLPLCTCYWWRTLSALTSRCSRSTQSFWCTRLWLAPNTSRAILVTPYGHWISQHARWRWSYGPMLW